MLLHPETEATNISITTTIITVTTTIITSGKVNSHLKLDWATEIIGFIRRLKLIGFDFRLAKDSFLELGKK